MSKIRKFDAIVVGAGSGLLISSSIANLGKNVAVIEKGEFGGTCLNRGCIPSKMLLYCADVAKTIKESGKFGISAKITKISWKDITQFAKHKVSEEAKEILEGNKNDGNITVFQETTKFVGKKVIEIGNTKIAADKIFISTGSRPIVPKIQGIEKVKYITSDEALFLKKQPKRLIIIGGGYIGCELAHFFESFGTKVSVIDRGSFLMKNEDSEIAEAFTESYKKRMNILLNSEIKQVSQTGKIIQVIISQNGKEKTISGDSLLIAAGRMPNTDMLNLSATGVKTNERGFVKVSKHLETSQKGIFAIGDVAGIFMFKHSANLEAECAFQNAFGKKQKVNYSAMPHAAFTSPQVSGVGATEDELKEKKTPYLKNICKYSSTGYGAAMRTEEGFVKALIHPKSRKILGCHIIGHHASILIHEVLVAMKANLTADDIANTVHSHPALSEVVQRAFEFR